MSVIIPELKPILMSNYLRILVILLIINFLPYSPLLVSSPAHARNFSQIEYLGHIAVTHQIGAISLRDYNRFHNASQVLYGSYDVYHSVPCCPSEVLFIFFRSPIIFHDYHYG